MREPLKLTFSPSLTALGAAGGKSLIYRVFADIDGKWRCTIDEGAGEYLKRVFSSKAKAMAFARSDFRRRQLVRAVA